MNLNELNYIRCIAKHGNLTKASSELYISQPTLSKYLQKIERELDIKLFNRIDNNYLPTYTGKRYLEYAENMLALHKEWEKELHDLKSLNTGELNIAFPLMRSSCMVPTLLPVFHQIHPHIQVNFLEETYSIQEKLLLDDHVDFAIFNETAPHPKLTYEALGEEEILLVLSPSHPLSISGLASESRRYPEIDLALFEQDPFILHFKEQTTGKLALALFEEHHISPPVLSKTRNTQVAIELAAKGLGVCFAPESYVTYMDKQIDMAAFSIAGSNAKSPLTIAYRKGAYLPSYAQDFIQITRSYIQENFHG